MKIIDNIKEVDHNEWGKFVASHSDGNFFQTPQYINFICTTDYTPIVLFALLENKIKGVLCGVLQKEGNGIKKILTSRIFIWGGPLADNNNVEIISNLLKRLSQKYEKQAIYFEFRNLFSVKNLSSIFNKNSYRYKAHFNYIVPVNNESETLKKISKSKIRQIKSSLKNGAQILEAKNEKEVNEFYAILKNLYKTKIKKPLPKVSFFFQFFLHKSAGKIFLIKNKDKVLGGIVCPIYTNSIIYEWYVCGLDKTEKGIYPSVLATYAPIEFAMKNGFNHFDFLGAGSADTDYGVREFKSKFGGKLVENGRYIKINKPILYKIGTIGLSILGKLKIL